MLKRLCSLVLVLSMVVALVSCGQNGVQDATEPSSSASASSAASSGIATPAIGSATTDSTEGMTFKESPLLAEKVAKGELPPVEERLPEEPCVSSAEEIGTYGGIFRGAGFGPTHGQVDTECLRITGLLRIEPDLNTLTPLLLKEYTVNDDFTEYILTLRKGLKWSDGEPFTSADFAFWYDDMLLNEEVTPAIAEKWKTEGEVMKLTAVDEVTVKVSFSSPYPAFDIVMMLTANPLVPNPMWAPKHYLEKWHIKYNPDADTLAKSEGYDNWALALAAHADRSPTGTDIDAPDLTPWILTKMDEQGNKYFDRNPYYFVVDKEGNQLPYIDQQISVIVADAQARTLKLMSGELHAAGENPLPVSDYTLYKDGETQGDYTVYMFDNTRGSDCSFTFNLTHQDPVLREIFNDIRFREAMSLAIDRQTINDVLYFGRAIARQAVPPDGTSFLEDWMVNYMIDFDLEGVASRLDEMGLTWNSSQTVRMRPDGKELNIILESTEEFAPMGEMVAEMWTAVGVKTSFKQQERSFARERYATNERDAQCFTFDAVAEFALRGNAEKIMPAWTKNEIGFAPAYREWYDTKGASGEEPPQEINDLREKIQKWLVMVPGSDEYIAAGKEILTVHTENLWYIGLTVAPRVVIISNKLGNTPSAGTFAGDYRFWYPYRGDSWYFK